MILFIDTETSGLDASRDCILQLSIVAEDNGVTSVFFDEYLRPPVRILRRGWIDAYRVNGISASMVESCKMFYQYRRRIQSIFDSADLIVGYNLGFDLEFLFASGIVEPPRGYNYVDVMPAFAPIFGEWSDKFGDFKWQKLTTCADYYGYTWQGKAHGALADALATQFCYHSIFG